MPWSSADAEAARSLSVVIDADCVSCATSLQTILRTWREIRKEAWPRWLEVGPACATFLHNRTAEGGQNWKMALHLSNVQNFDFATTPLALPPLHTRKLLDLMAKDASKASKEIVNMGLQGLIAWAPVDNDSLQRVVATFEQVVRTEINFTCNTYGSQRNVYSLAEAARLINLSRWCFSRSRP